MENFPYLFAAYSVVLVAIFGYLFLLDRRERRLKQDVDWLREKLKSEGRPEPVERARPER